MEQQIYRSQDNKTQKKYYSGKQKQHTLKTQMVTNTEHETKAVRPEFPGSVHDKTLSDQIDTVGRMEDGSLMIGDKAYQGRGKEESLIEVTWDDGEHQQQALPRATVLIPQKNPPKRELSERQKEANQMLNSIRVRAEHCIGWLKNFKMFGTRFRCDHGSYTRLLRIVCGFVNLQTRRWKEKPAFSNT